MKFEEDFEIWGDVEYILGLLNESPIISSDQKKQSFELLKSVTDYKSQKGAQEGLDSYFARHLSLCNSTNDLLEKQMNEIILKQIQALHEEKLLKYS